jgi:hypothetical protein
MTLVPFSIRDLTVLAYANGFTLWHYKTNVALADVMSSNYFADAQDMIVKGDMIMCSTADGGKLFFVVSSEHESVYITSI